MRSRTKINDPFSVFLQSQILSQTSVSGGGSHGAQTDSRSAGRRKTLFSLFVTMCVIMFRQRCTVLPVPVGGRCNVCTCCVNKVCMCAFNTNTHGEVVGVVCCRWCVFSLKVRDASVVRRERCAGGGAALLCVAWKREKVGEGKGVGRGWVGGLALTEGPG